MKAMSILFWRRKEKTPKNEVEVAEVESMPKAPKDPIASFIQRLQQIIDDPSVAEKAGQVSSTRIQFIVGGIPILLSKEGIKPLMISRTRSTQADVFIRMSENAADQLADTETLANFGQLYHKFIVGKDKDSYISIKLQTPLEGLRQQGYFRVNILRTLIDA